MRVNTSEVARALERCASDHRLVIAIVAVAGATEAGTFDDCDALGQLAEKYETWLHVDAAWGGGLIFSSARDELYKGIARANSVTLDPHKQLLCPMGCGMILFRDPDAYRGHGKSANYIVRSVRAHPPAASAWQLRRGLTR